MKNKIKNFIEWFKAWIFLGCPIHFTYSYNKYVDEAIISMLDSPNVTISTIKDKLLYFDYRTFSVSISIIGGSYPYGTLYSYIDKSKPYDNRIVGLEYRPSIPTMARIRKLELDLQNEKFKSLTERIKELDKN